MEELPRPVFLLADSQLLFWRSGDKHFLKSITDLIPKPTLKVAYLGASNDNQLVFYQLFREAMQLVRNTQCHLIPLKPAVTDFEFLSTADLIFLAGGDVCKGWENFSATGIREIIPDRYQQGAILIGISAGAVQLGCAGWDEFQRKPFSTFGIVPYLIDVHAEAEDWPLMHTLLHSKNTATSGIGIPAGGGLIFYPDQRIASVRFPAIRFTRRGSEIFREKI